MRYEATADKDGISTSGERAQPTQRVDHQHIVLKGERDAGGATCIPSSARIGLEGAMTRHLILVHRGHSHNTRHPVGVSRRKHQ